MRLSCSLVIASALLLPLQAVAQSGSVGSSGGGSAGVTTGTAPGTTGSPNAPRSAAPNTPGTNSLGPAQSSGGVTTGSAGGNTAVDKNVEDENRKIDQKLKSICKGC